MPDCFVALHDLFDKPTLLHLLESPDLPALFLAGVQDFLNRIPTSFTKWTHDLIKADNLMPIGECEPHSTSVVDLFAMLIQVIAYVKSFEVLEESLPVKDAFTLRLAQGIAHS